MTPVSAYVKKLLYQYDCLVVPDLGAFLTHSLPATYVESTGLFLPPRKKLAFNEALRLDDGILTNYVMLHDGCSREEALRHIHGFVSELKQEVRQSGSLALDGIGLFTLNDEGKLQFDPELRHNFHGEAYGMQPIQVGEWMKQNQPLEAVQVLPVIKQASESDVIETEEVLPALLNEPPRRRVVWPWVAAAVFVGALVGISYFSVIDTTEPLQSSLSPGSLFRMSFLFTDKEPVKQESQQATPVVVKAPLPTELLAMAEPKEVPVKPVKVEPEPKVILESRKTESVAVPVKPATPVAEVKVAPVVIRPQFIVIAGSFSNRQNAARFQRQMRKEGYSDAYVIKPVRKGQLYKVGVYGSANRLEAVDRLGEVSTLTGQEAWIMTY